MAVDNEKRTLMDFGLVFGELIALSFSIFTGSIAIQKEIETKTIYLILSRPVLNSEYIAGKLIGIYLRSAFIYIVVSFISILLLISKGYTIPSIYFISIVFSFLKIIIISSFSLLITSFTTSSFSSVLISILLWVSGHFISEMKYLLDKITGIKYYLLNFLLFIMPNFQLFNIKDYISLNNIDFSKPLIYFVSYLVILYIANILVFKNKEF